MPLVLPARFCLIPAILLSCAALPAADVTFVLRDQKQAPIVDAVISLKPSDPATPMPRTDAPAPAEIEQVGQEFIPFVTAVRTGSAVRFPNRDTVEHYVYSESTPKRIQLPLYAPGKAEIITFDQAGVVSLGCNIHDWMLAYVVVVETPWFARTAAGGSATIPGVPPGKYRAEVWHPRLTRADVRDITVSDGAAPVEVSLALKPDRRIRRSPDSAKASYR